MLLRELKRYAEERMDLPPTLYISAPVRYIIELDPQGRLLTPEPIDTSDPANRSTRRGMPRPVPQIQRAAGIKPLLLVDKSDYVLGYVPDIEDQSESDREKKERRVLACHAAYLDLLERCDSATGESTLSAVLAFLRSNPLEQLSLAQALTPARSSRSGSTAFFQPNFRAFSAFWAAENAPDPDDPKAHVMQCIDLRRRAPGSRPASSKGQGGARRPDVWYLNHLGQCRRLRIVWPACAR